MGERLESIVSEAKSVAHGQSGRVGVGFLTYIGVMAGSIYGALGPVYSAVSKWTESPEVGALAATASFVAACYAATRAGKELAKR